MSFEQRVVQLEETNAELVKEVVRVRDAAAGLNRIHNSVSEGRQAVGDGQYFVVPQEGAYLRLYRRDGSSAEPIAEFASAAALQQAIDDAEADAEARMNAGADRAEVYADNKGFVKREMLRREATLDLDFAAGRYSVDDGEKLRAAGEDILTVERASPKWVMGPNGKLREVPPDTLAREWKDGKCQGALIEESRTNLLRWSQDFSNSIWPGNGFGDSIPEAAIAPDGSHTAYKIVEDTSNGVHRVDQRIDQQVGFITVSVFAKAAERPGLRFEFSREGLPSPSVHFDLRTQEIVGGDPERFESIEIQDFGNGWARYIGTFEIVEPSSSRIHYFTMLDEESLSGSQNYQGDGESGIYIWGAQLEEGAIPSSYIPTEDAPVTRAADDVSRALGGEFNAGEGTIVRYVKWADRGAVLYIGEAGGDNRVLVAQSYTNMTTNGSTLSRTNLPELRENYLLAVTYRKSEGVVRVYRNGMEMWTFDDCPDFTQAKIRLTVGRTLFSGWPYTPMGIHSDVYIPRALSEEELIALTTPDSEE